jgi:hypothetical protein
LAEIGARLWRENCEAVRGKLPVQRDKRRMQRLPAVVSRQLLRAYLWLDRRFRLPSAGRIERALNAPVLVNYLGFPGAPPMRAYKATRFPTESSLINITMGPTEPKPVAQRDRVVVRPIAPLFVRVDHRTADATLLARFAETLRQLLSRPACMEPNQNGQGTGPVVSIVEHTENRAA